MFQVCSGYWAANESYILPEKPAERFLLLLRKTGQVLKRKIRNCSRRVGIVDMGTYMPVERVRKRERKRMEP